MTKSTELTRIYSMEDATMLEMAKTKRSFFIEDKADFIAFDPAFADGFCY